MQNEKQEIVFDAAEDLLITMIKGRRFEYQGVTYSCYSKGTYEFRWDKENGEPESIGDWGIIESLHDMLNLLVGSTLIEVDPQFIAKDTLLLVSDDSDMFDVNSKVVPKKRYFSHWYKGRIYTFIDGATSLTTDDTMGWDHWEFASQEK